MGLLKGVPDIRISESGARWQWLAILLIAAGLLLVGGESVREWLRFERAAIADGELWRLLTGHLVHLGWSHFALDAVGLCLVWYLVGESLTAAGWAIVGIASIGAIDAGFWFMNPELQWYVGLSGLLHGILAGGILASLRRPRAEILVLGLLLCAKLAWEQAYGPLPGTETASGGPVVVDAHLYGSIGGVLAVTLLLIRARWAREI